MIDFLSETIALIDGADRLIGMGGYNTACEVLSLNKDGLIVPRATPRAEQLIRAERLASLGLIDMLHPDEISAKPPDGLDGSSAQTVELPLPDQHEGLKNVTLFAAQAFAAKPPHIH
ncbi:MULTISPECIES: hypothetical protein [unclassified Paracoccus (in: a-proteobacteria)]|uniref:hypothetical protein n=1 Tax=unclassified Paracoccus (in: a-proteobacteria) TaxID=2688777 RepID=UPI0016045DA6|nr:MULTISPECIES: hypothetical protein [unclassified Paracoccus (in: a-proteobacteria)]MBB1490150.1 hypothetical protein [Paracoccus sp. MC1854]MBB1496737.1 hypothetical protein [Paracoccus sp. MC1862]QQO43741.1 hypothetical protein JGR78_09845 [Paracoccus sp. MC1862]